MEVTVNQLVYMHSRHNEAGIIAVIEPFLIVDSLAGQRLGQYSVGWSAKQLFERELQAITANFEDATHREDISVMTTGTPRALLLGVPLADLQSQVGAHVVYVFLPPVLLMLMLLLLLLHWLSPSRPPTAAAAFVSSLHCCTPFALATCHAANVGVRHNT